MSITTVNIDASAYVKKSELPSNLTLYPTNVASSVVGYSLMVTDIEDPSYNTIAVNIPTGAITTTGQLIASLATTNGQLTGNPGQINISTIGNVRRISGSGTATFYYEIYLRTGAGVETLIGTSSNTLPVSLALYTEFQADALFNNGIWEATDKIVVKYYANRIAGGSNPSYEFQFGGALPVRTIVPVPAAVIVDLPITVGSTSVNNGTNGKLLNVTAGKVGEVTIDTTPTDGSTNPIDSNAVFDGLAFKENVANKQNSLAIDGTGVKFPTVDALNSYGITVDLIDALTVDFALGYAYKINSVTNVTNAPTTTILDDGLAYVLGATIAANSVMTVSVDLAARVQLNVTRL